MVVRTGGHSKHVLRTIPVEIRHGNAMLGDQNSAGIIYAVMKAGQWGLRHRLPDGQNPLFAQLVKKMNSEPGIQTLLLNRFFQVGDPIHLGIRKRARQTAGEMRAGGMHHHQLRQIHRRIEDQGVVVGDRPQQPVKPLLFLAAPTVWNSLNGGRGAEQRHPCFVLDQRRPPIPTIIFEKVKGVPFFQPRGKTGGVVQQKNSFEMHFRRRRLQRPAFTVKLHDLSPLTASPAAGGRGHIDGADAFCIGGDDLLPLRSIVMEQVLLNR
ncbi:MAG: hypothetical protein BWY83_02840 [bacterium ADurb.Bin478]|nr:MAG: hypothetical protein BWY83_02840 [bacterium ADurb.Bin478]